MFIKDVLSLGGWMKKGVAVIALLFFLVAVGMAFSGDEQNNNDGVDIKEKVEQKYGEKWNVEINDETNFTKRLIGYNIDIKNEEVKKEQELLKEKSKIKNKYLTTKSLSINYEDVIDSVIKDFILNNNNILGINLPDIKKVKIDYDKPHSKEFESGTWYAFYEQEYQGIQVYKSYINFIIIDDKIVSVSNNFYQGISMPINPSVSKDDALEIIKGDLNDNSVITYDSSLVIYPDETKDQVEYNLTWYILANTWKYFIDAHNGKIIHKETTIKDGTISGTVTGMVYIPNSKFNQTLVNISNNNITAIHDGIATLYNVTENNTGSYNITGVSGTLEIRSYLEGPYVKVFNGTTNRVNHTFTASAILTNFSNGKGSENLTYDLTKNITRQLNTTKNNKIVNAKLTLRGFNNTVISEINASEASAPLYNITNVPNDAYGFILNSSQANFTCTNYTFSIYNYSSGNWCSFAQNTITESCTGYVESKIFNLETTSCNDFSNFVNNNKVQFNLSGVGGLETVKLNYTITNLSSPKNLTIFINSTKAYFNSTFNNLSRLDLNTSLLQDVLDACQEETPEGNCLINITFFVGVEANNSQLEYSDLNMTHIVPTHNINWNESDNSIRNEETNVFYHINIIHDFFTKSSPFNITAMNYKIIARVGSLNQCNANFDSSTQTINFGKNNYCDDNIALDSDVIYHEYAHAVVDSIYSTLPYSGQTGAMDEGFADFWAAAINNNSKLGESSFSSGTSDCSNCLRNLNNTVKKPTSWSEVHDDSRSFAGALWDTRVLLGANEAEPLIMRAMKAQPHSFSEMMDNILLFNDNNSDLTDGTPDSSLICQAFTTNHGIQSPFCNSSLGSYKINNTIGSKFYDAVENGKKVSSSESTEGVEGMDDDDITNAIGIGFNFPFFNVNYSQIYIGSDGIVFFEAHTINTFGDFPVVIPIADFSTPNNFISVYRHDLNPNENSVNDDGGGDVYYWKDTNNNRFIVEWLEVRTFGSTNNQTFELIIYKDGRIIFQYLNITDASVTDVTVGIENSGGKFGINYINASSIDNHDPLGICFLPIDSSIKCSNPPNIDHVNISSSDHLNRTNGTLHGLLSFTDLDGDTVTNDTRWYKNGVEDTSLRNLISISSSNTTKGEKWNFSIKIFEGDYTSNFINTSMTINNAKPEINITINNTSADSITVSETQQVNITTNASDIDNDALTFTINDSSRFSLNGIYFIWNTNLTDSGTYNVNITVNDTEGIDSKLITVTVLDARDLDNDGDPDFNDTDDDNDNINDDNDFLLGDASSINSTPSLNLNLTINGTANLSKLFNGTFPIIITVNVSNNLTNATLRLVEFEYTFNSSNILDFGKITTNYTIAGFSAVSLKGLTRPSSNFTKNFTIDKVNTTAKAVCIKDADVSFESISSSCNGNNEFLVNCNNVTSNGYTCFDTGTRYKIMGLNHSALKELCVDNDGDGYGDGCNLGTDSCDSNPSQHTSSGCNPPSDNNGGGGGDSGGGGGGGGGGGLGVFYICNTDWSCASWSSCENGWQTRECSFVKVPQHTTNESCATVDNVPQRAKKCKAVGKLENKTIEKTASIPDKDSKDKSGIGITGAAVRDTERKTDMSIGIPITIITVLVGILIYLLLLKKKNEN